MSLTVVMSLVPAWGHENRLSSLNLSKLHSDPALRGEKKEGISSYSQLIQSKSVTLIQQQLK